MDIGTIRSRIMGQCIKSAKELFRDLLLVANNALVFYSRRTREYKSAVSLRVLVMKEYKLFFSRGYCNVNEATSASFIPPVKPRTARPRPKKLPSNVVVGSEKQCKIHNISSINVSKPAGLLHPPPKTTPAVKHTKRLRR